MAVQHTDLGRLARLNRHGPRAVLDAGAHVARESISLRGREIHVFGAGGAVVGVEGVHGLHFAGVGVHAAGGFTWDGLV